MNDIILVASAAAVLAVALAVPFGKSIEDIRKRMSALRRIGMKLDLLMQHANIEFEPYKGLPPEVVDALQRGEKLETIRAYLKVRTRDLKEAKKVIEDVQRRAGGWAVEKTTPNEYRIHRAWLQRSGRHGMLLGGRRRTRYGAKSPGLSRLIKAATNWWPRPDSNRHSGFPEADFKSAVSTVPPRGHARAFSILPAPAPEA